LKTINATLTANQKLPYGFPIATATLADAGRLHLTRYFTHTKSGKFSAGVKAASSFNRVRAGSDGVYVQRITDPTVSSQWTTWTLITSDAAVSNVAPAIFYTGTYVVIVWQTNATSEILYKRSADDGVSYGATTNTGYGTPPAAELSGVSFDNVVSGMMLTYGSQLYWASYNGSTNVWSALASAGITMLTTPVSCAGLLDGAANRLVVAYVPVEVTGLYRLKLMTYDLGGGGWSTVRVFFESRTTGGVGRVSLSQAKLSGYWWLLFTRAKEWGGTKHYLAPSDDGLFYQDFVTLDADVANDFHLLGELPAASGFTYAANDATVLRSSAQTFWSAQTVRSYKFSAELSQPSEITLDVDNRLGALAEPKLFSKLTLDRGLRIDGTDYTVGAGSFFVTRYLYIVQDNLIRIEAADALGLLALWSADQTLLYSGERVDALVELVCALAGVHVVAFDAASVWANTLSAFAINANTTALSALRELQARASFEAVAKQDGSLSCFVPTAAPASGYTYGSASGQHAHWPGLFGRTQAPTALFVAGLYDPAVPQQYGGEAHDLAAQAAQGFRLSDLLRDDRLITDAQASALASSRLILAQEAARVGTLDAPPSFSLEPGDVVDLGSGWPSTNGPWRVHAFAESYNAPGPRKFFQRLTLRGTA